MSGGEYTHDFERVIKRLDRLDKGQDQVNAHLERQNGRIGKLEESQGVQDDDIHKLQGDVEGLLNVVDTVQRYGRKALAVAGVILLSAMIEIVKTVVGLVVG